MFMCDKTVTLVRKNSSGAYEYRLLPGVSFFGKKRQGLDKNGEELESAYTVRIPQALLGSFVPRPGDYIARGAQALPVEQLADYFRINTVGENLCGRLAHWVVKGT